MRWSARTALCQRLIKVWQGAALTGLRRLEPDQDRVTFRTDRQAVGIVAVYQEIQLVVSDRCHFFLVGEPHRLGISVNGA